MNDKEKDIEQILESVSFNDEIDQKHKDVLEQKLLLNFNGVRTRHGSRRRNVMSRNITKFAAAAVIMIGLFIGYKVFNGTGSELWAQVREQVAAVKAVVYKAKVNRTLHGQDVELRIEALMAEEYGARMDVYVGDKMMSQVFALINEKSCITVFPEIKKYLEMEFTEANRLENGDPKVMVETFLKGNYKNLGRREIDGVTVEGIESDDITPSAGVPGGGRLLGDEDEFRGTVVGQLWVDVETGWPVEVTLDITDEKNEEHLTVTVHDFQWDAQIDPATFTDVIPAGYELMYKVQADVSARDGQLVDGLKYFASINDGKYPTKLSVRDVVGEIGKIYGAKSGLKLDDGEIVKLKYGAEYFSGLESDGKEAMYYGGSVTAADTDKVLVRWKLDDGKYRVIFGDLRVEDVSAGRLGELEAK